MTAEQTVFIDAAALWTRQAPGWAAWCASVRGEQPPAPAIKPNPSLLSPNEILYRFTIEDPALYSAAWSAEYSLHREHTTAYENGCHEGNYSLPNILRAERLKEARQRKPR